MSTAAPRRGVPLLERLGVKDEVDRIGMPKYGVVFVSPALY